jgi:hypothetical protein
MTVVQDIDYDEFESIIFGEETTETYEVQISDIEVRDSNYYYPDILYYSCVKWHILSREEYLFSFAYKISRLPHFCTFCMRTLFNKLVSVFKWPPMTLKV